MQDDSSVGYEGDDAEQLELLVDGVEATFAGLAQAYDRRDLRGGYRRWRGDDPLPEDVIRRPPPKRSPLTAIACSCATCGRTLPRRPGRGRPSRYCSERCRADAENASKRAKRAVTSAPTNVVPIVAVATPLQRALAITGRPWSRLTSDEMGALWRRDPDAALALFNASSPEHGRTAATTREAA
jgi:hypothetical protein